MKQTLILAIINSSKMKKIYTLLAVFMCAFNFAGAQYANQQAFYNNLPQAKYTNPGILPDYNGYLSIPALSGYGVTLSNSSFAFNDLFHDGNLSPNNLLSSMQNKNLFNISSAVDVIGFGLKFGKNFIALNVTPKTDVNLGYSKSVFDFLINGNGNYIGQSISLDGFSFDVSSYVETGIGYTREINDKLSAGARVKLLSGLGNVNGDFDGISLYTDPNDYSLTASSNFAINAYGTFFADSELAQQMGNPPYFNPNNLGLGLDLGVNYQFSDNIQIFGSIVDLGYLKWSEYGETLYNDGASFKFDGLPLDELLGSEDDTNDGSNFSDDLMDTLSSTFNLQRSQISYTTGLKTQIYAGASYRFTDYVVFQGMLHGRVFNNKLYPMYMFSGGINLKRWLSAKLTYSGINKTYNNIGAGVVLHAGAFQVYAMMDNLYGLTQIDHTRNLAGSFGINFTFKDKDDKKIKKAKGKKKKAENKKDKAKDKKKKAEDKKEKAEDKKEKAENKKEEAEDKKEKAENKKKKAEENKTVKQFNAKEKELKSEASKEKSDATEIKKETKVINEQKKDLKSEAKEVKSEAKEINKEAKAINEKEKELKAQAKDVKSDAKEIKNETKGINEQKKDLKSEAKDVKSDTKEIKKEAKAINEKEKELKSEVKAVKSDTKEIKEETKALENKVISESTSNIQYSEIAEKDSTVKVKSFDVELLKDSVPAMATDTIGVRDSLKLESKGGGL